MEHDHSKHALDDQVARKRAHKAVEHLKEESNEDVHDWFVVLPQFLLEGSLLLLGVRDGSKLFIKLLLLFFEKLIGLVHLLVGDRVSRSNKVFVSNRFFGHKLALVCFAFESLLVCDKFGVKSVWILF